MAMLMLGGLASVKDDLHPNWIVRINYKKDLRIIILNKEFRA